MSTKPREWWIGRTQYGFDKWLSKKDPDSDVCAYKFLSSDGQDECVEMIHVIEHSAYQALEQKLAVAIVTLAYYQSAWDVGSKATKALAIINADNRKETKEK